MQRECVSVCVLVRHLSPCFSGATLLLRRQGGDGVGVQPSFTPPHPSSAQMINYKLLISQHNSAGCVYEIHTSVSITVTACDELLTFISHKPRCKPLQNIWSTKTVTKTIHSFFMVES